MRNPFATPAPPAEVAELRQQLDQQANNAELLQESITELEAQLREPGWVRMIAQSDVEFTTDGLHRIAAASRLMSIKNPLIVRGVAVACAYVWGQGVQIEARATGKSLDNPGEQDVNAVVQAFLADPANKRTLTGDEARIRIDRSLRTDGNIFVTLFTKPASGRVQARMVPFEQITEVVCNPDDASEPQFYRRRWTEQTVNPGTGTTESVSRERLYPAVGYRPRSRPAAFGRVPVAWDSPVVHIKVNDLEGWRFGIGDVYAAVDWAIAYKDFLTDWARLMKSLSRYAWKLTATGSRGARAAVARIGQVPSVTPSGELNIAGATAGMTADVKLEAVSKSGATLDSESGRPLAAMAAAALGIPVTMVLGDPGVTGARATAETLDQPTELGMQLRQGVWTSALQQILGYVITEAARAPQGPLRGTVVLDEDGRETLALAGDTEPTIDVMWPELDDIEPQLLVDAIVKASGTGTIPPEHIARLLMQALGVDHVDEIIDKLVDDDGQFLWPSGPPLGGQAAADAARGGNDPAGTGPGSMTPDASPADQGGDTSGGQQADSPTATPTAGGGRGGG